MLKRLSVLVLVMVATVATSAQDLPINPNIRIGTLDNGVTYYIWPEGCRERASVRLVVPVGSVNEMEEERGLAHLVEHLMFRGTRNFSKPDIDAFLNSIDATIGPDANAATGFDSTTYMLEIPADDLGALATGLNLMSEWLGHARLGHRDIEAERAIVLEEWRLGLGANAHFLEALVPALFPNSQYAQRLPIGLPEVVGSASPETIRNFYHRWYDSAPVAVIVAGQVDADCVEALILDAFGSLERAPRHCPMPSYPVPLDGSRRIEVVSDPLFESTAIGLLVNRAAQPTTTVDALREDLCRHLFHSLLNRRFVNAAGGVDFPCDASSGTSPLVRPVLTHFIDVDCFASDAEAACRCLLLELRRAVEHGFSEAELNWVKQSVLIYLEAVVCGEIPPMEPYLADRCIRHYMLGGELMDEEVRTELVTELLQEIQLHEINQLAGTFHLDQDCLLFVTTDVPEEIFDLNEERIEEIIREVSRAPLAPCDEAIALGNLMSRPVRAGRIVQTEKIDSIGLTSWTLENGMRVHVLPRPFGAQDVQLRSLAWGGLTELMPDQVVEGRMAAILLEESGVGPYSPEELYTRLAGQWVYLDRYINPLYRELEGGCSPRHLETLFQLIHLSFTQQCLSEPAFEETKRYWLSHLYEQQVDPDAAFEALTDEVNFSNHPLLTSPSAAAVAAADFQVAATIALEAFANPGDFELFIAGDFDLPQIRELVERYLATIPDLGLAAPQGKPLEVAFPSQVTIDGVVMGGEPQSRVAITFPVDLEYASSEELALAYLAADVVSARIHNLLRNSLRGTYGAGAYLHFCYPDLRSGRLSIRFCCDPEDAQALALITVRELRLMAQVGAYQDEVDFYWGQMVRNHRERGSSLGCLLHRLIHCALFGRSFESVAEPDITQDKVTVEAVNQLLQLMISMDRYSLIFSFPESDGCSALPIVANW